MFCIGLLIAILSRLTRHDGVIADDSRRTHHYVPLGPPCFPDALDGSRIRGVRIGFGHWFDSDSILRRETQYQPGLRYTFLRPVGVVREIDRLFALRRFPRFQPGASARAADGIRDDEIRG